MKPKRDSKSKLFYRIFSLLLIVGLAFVLRVAWLDKAPSGGLIDEVHFGFLAKSLMLTGKDEHGVSWPIVFKGFGDQKLPLNAYLFIPFVKIFGLNLFGIRIQSVIFGSLLVGVVYLLARELKLRHEWALLASFIAALSPWGFFLSRFGFESNTALFFFSLSLLTFIKLASSQRYKWLFSSSFLIALTWYSYIAYRPVTLAIAIFFVGFLWWRRKINLKLVAAFFISFFVMVAPLFSSQASQANTARFEQVGILSDPGIALEINENREFCSHNLPVKICYFVWNKPTTLIRELASRYLKVFSPNFLSLDGEEEAYIAIKHFGQISLFIYPFFLIGLVTLLSSPRILKVGDEAKLLILSGLLLSPIPTVLVGDPQKVRMSMFLPFLIITTLLGIVLVTRVIKNHLPNWGSYLFLSGLIILFTWDSLSYVANFYAVHTTQHEYYYQSYVRDLMNYLTQTSDETLVVIKPYFSDPLMFYAFYADMDPQLYQERAVLGELEASGFQHTVELGRLLAHDWSPEQVACHLGDEYSQGLLATDKQYSDFPVVKELKATNGVHSYGWVYQVDKLDCQN